MQREPRVPGATTHGGEGVPPTGTMAAAFLARASRPGSLAFDLHHAGPQPELWTNEPGDGRRGGEVRGPARVCLLSVFPSKSLRQVWPPGDPSRLISHRTNELGTRTATPPRLLPARSPRRGRLASGLARANPGHRVRPECAINKDALHISMSCVLFGTRLF